MSPGKELMWFIWKWKQAPHATKWRVCTVNSCNWVIYITAIRINLRTFCVNTSALRNINSFVVLITIQLKNILAKAVAVHFSHLINVSNFETSLILVERQTTQHVYMLCERTDVCLCCLNHECKRRLMHHLKVVWEKNHIHKMQFT